MLPTERQQKILALLQDRGTVTIQELGGLFGVSDMTIHRDLDRMAAGGHLHKVRGGAVLPGTAVSDFSTTSKPGDDTTCWACHGRINPRTQMVLHQADGRQWPTCCPHCGLLSLARLGTQVNLALATDFLHGRKVSAQTAVYVFDPAIAICCNPTTLAFLRREEAEQFQRGFGGQVLDFAAATTAVQAAMLLGDHREKSHDHTDEDL
ncbi:MAG: DeoR/GlpR transcriptional regulator [Ardenticatenaceae bacterium]|nr:DeoR/GlpR transcriptional regulator [Ardenticatenaceae bacterium]